MKAAELGRETSHVGGMPSRFKVAERERTLCSLCRFILCPICFPSVDCKLCKGKYLLCLLPYPFHLVRCLAL